MYGLGETFHWDSQSILRTREQFHKKKSKTYLKIPMVKSAICTMNTNYDTPRASSVTSSLNLTTCGANKAVTKGNSSYKQRGVCGKAWSKYDLITCWQIAVNSKWDVEDHQSPEDRPPGGFRTREDDRNDFRSSNCSPAIAEIRYALTGWLESFHTLQIINRLTRALAIWQLVTAKKHVIKL